MIYNFTVIYRDSIHGNPGHKYAIWASCCGLQGGAKLRVIEKHPGPLNTSLYWDEACLGSGLRGGDCNQGIRETAGITAALLGCGRNTTLWADEDDSEHLKVWYHSFGKHVWTEYLSINTLVSRELLLVWVIALEDNFEVFAQVLNIFCNFLFHYIYIPSFVTSYLQIACCIRATVAQLDTLILKKCNQKKVKTGWIIGWTLYI